MALSDISNRILRTAWTIFAGGMPRASYSDKYTVTVMKGEDKHSVFDLSSKVVDFKLINGAANVPESLIVLAEEELVVVDLTEDSWPAFPSPYLNSIHASAVTCLSHVEDVDNDVYDKISAAGKEERKGKFSERAWPISGGQLPEGDQSANNRDVLVTGHEDGSVKVWSCGTIALSLLATVRTNKFFVGDELDEPPPEDDDDEDEWPPFRKVGQYDPYSDDPRLAVKKLWLCPTTGRLVVGGTAGQVIVLELSEAAAEKPVLHVKSDLVTEKEGFAWKGHSALDVRAGDLKMAAGYQPRCVLQVSPPASINSLGSCTDWGLMAAGTAHGLVILDCLQSTVILSKCTLNAQGKNYIDFFILCGLIHLSSNFLHATLYFSDIANADDNPMSRRKSLKKSLRESFRKLRKGRSQRNIDKKRPGQTTTAASATDPIKRSAPAVP
jgi:lethal(2) giant larvae protein